MPDLVNPQAREAPRLKKSETSELWRFISRFEEELEKANITDDAKKLENVIRFVDTRLEREFKALDSYENQPPSWEKFKSDLEENYPEAHHDARGAIEGLEKLRHRYHGLDQRSKTTLAQYIREFKTEWKDVQAALGDADGVKRFCECLSESFHQEIMSRIRNRRDIEKRLPVPSTVPATALPTPKTNEWFTLKEVMEVAITLANEQAGMAAFFVQPSGEPRASASNRLTSDISSDRPLVKIEPKDNVIRNLRDEFQQEMSVLKDTIKVIERNSDNAVNSIKDHVTQLFKNQSHSVNKGSTLNSYGNHQGTEECYYCGERGHRVLECTARQEDMQAGLVRLDRNNRLEMGDGSPIPRGLPIRNGVKAKSAKNLMFEVVFEDENPQKNYTQLYQAPKPVPQPKNDQLDKLTENVDKLMNFMSSFVMNSMVNTRQKEYEDQPSK
jgi:hypothetical protein